MQQLLAPLVSVKDGAELEPAVCRWTGPPASCASDPTCTWISNDDESVFVYDPPTTTVLDSCWTLAEDCPIPETQGTLHYCQQPNATATITLRPGLVAGPAIRLATLVFKSGPDCGYARILLDKQVVIDSWDTYAAAVTWTDSVVVARGLDASTAHELKVQVLGARVDASTDAWVQLVGVALWS